MKKLILSTLLNAAIGTAFGATTSTPEYMSREDALALLDKLLTDPRGSAPFVAICQRLNKHSQTGLEALSDVELEKYNASFKGQKPKAFITLEKIRRDHNVLKEVKKELVQKKRGTSGKRCENKYFYYKFIFIQLPNLAPDPVTEELLEFLLVQLIEESEADDVAYHAREVNESSYKELLECAHYIAKKLSTPNATTRRLAEHMKETLRTKVPRAIYCNYIRKINSLLLVQPWLSEVFSDLIPFLLQIISQNDYDVYPWEKERLSFMASDDQDQQKREHASRTHASALWLLKELSYSQSECLITAFCKKNPDLKNLFEEEAPESAGK